MTLLTRYFTVAFLLAGMVGAAFSQKTEVPQLELHKHNIGVLTEQLKELSQQFGDEHPRIVRLKAEIAGLERLVEAEMGSSDMAQQESDATALFDGTNLEHWRGYANEAVAEGWKIMDDGSLMLDVEGGRGRGGDLVTKEAYGSFELTFDWKVSEGANSGVMYRVGMGDQAPYLTGPEYQVLDDAVHRDGANPKTAAGSLFALYEAAGKTLNEVGQWNTAKIVVNGNNVQHWLNGVKVVDVELHSADWQEQVAASKFAKWEKFASQETGHIVFQDHGDRVWYRNIMVQTLDAETEEAGSGTKEAGSATKEAGSSSKEAGSTAKEAGSTSKE